MGDVVATTYSTMASEIFVVWGQYLFTGMVLHEHWCSIMLDIGWKLRMLVAWSWLIKIDYVQRLKPAGHQQATTLWVHVRQPWVCIPNLLLSSDAKFGVVTWDDRTSTTATKLQGEKITWYSQQCTKLSLRNIQQVDIVGQKHNYCLKVFWPQLLFN